MESEKAHAKRLEHECQSLSTQVQEDIAQKQLFSDPAEDSQHASTSAQEESDRVAELSTQLEKERSITQSLLGELNQERTRSLQTEARAESQLAQFDTEREQIQAKLHKEESRGRELQELIECLRKELEEVSKKEILWKKKVEEVEEKKKAEKKQGKLQTTSTACQTDPDLKAATLEKFQRLRLNGHQVRRESDEDRGTENGGVENGGGLSSPVHQSLSPSSTASNSLSSSPCSSPVLAKRLASLGTSSPTYPSSYQASVNQRFHAARHKFQQQSEQGTGMPMSPRELSPTSTPVPPLSDSSAKQMARNTVTQVLSRFTNQQAVAKSPSSNSSPFGTDYRTLASASSPTSKVPGPLSSGIRSPIIQRGEKSNLPSPTTKKPGGSANPGSPVPVSSPRSAQFPELSGSCGISSTQEGTKEIDLLMTKSS